MRVESDFPPSSGSLTSKGKDFVSVPRAWPAHSHAPPPPTPGYAPPHHPSTIMRNGPPPVSHVIYCYVAPVLIGFDCA